MANANQNQYLADDHEADVSEVDRNHQVGEKAVEHRVIPWTL
jgi:hypothetical protein